VSRAVINCPLSDSYHKQFTALLFDFVPDCFWKRKSVLATPAAGGDVRGGSPQVPVSRLRRMPSSRRFDRNYQTRTKKGQSDAR